MRDFEEVGLEVGARVIGDLHLDLEEPRDVERFVAYLAGLGSVPRLIVLGDLFEYWIGAAQARSDGGRRVLSALHACVQAGTEIEVIPHSTRKRGTSSG